MTALDVFRPNKDEPKDCLVMNTDGSALTNMMGRTEAEAYGARIVAGRVPHLVGTIEVFVVKVTPLTRLRDRQVSDSEVVRLDVT